MQIVDYNYAIVDLRSYRLSVSVDVTLMTDHDCYDCVEELYFYFLFRKIRSKTTSNGILAQGSGVVSFLIMSEDKACSFFRKKKRPAVRQRADEDEKGISQFTIVIEMYFSLYINCFVHVCINIGIDRSSDDETQVVRKKVKGPQGPLVQSVS